MRIFTLGKNGIPLFLFAFILFSGTYSSYGQACPVVNDQNPGETGNQQYFCDSEQAEVSDLNATGDDVVWYADQSTLTPLASTQLLTNGTTYYAGNSAGTCAGNREEVTVTIYSEPDILGLQSTRKTSPTKQSLSVIGVCVADLDNPGVTVGDLRTSADDNPDLTVNWYYSRTDTTPIPLDTPLQDDTDYFASVTSNITGCETNRRKTTVQLNSEPAPTGPAEQSFCAADSPTLSDIEVTGNTRFFPSETSETELSPNTPLVDGRTYYISSLGEDCESFERLAVTVTLVEVSAGTNKTAELCLAEAQTQLATVESARAFFTGLLDEGVSTEGTFDPSMETIISQFEANQLGTYTTTYTITNEEGCPGSVDMTLTVVEDPDAGDNHRIITCLSDIQTRVTSAEEMRALFLGMLDEGIDQTGTFEPGIEDLYALYETNPVGEFATIYTVTSGGCEDDAELSLIVVEDPDAGTDTSVELCLADAQPHFTTAEDATAFFLSLLDEGIAQNGTFEPTIETLMADFETNPIGTFQTTYTVTGGECEDEAVLTLTVAEDPDAGAPTSMELCLSEAEAQITTVEEARSFFLGLLETGVDQTGTFDPSIDDIFAQYSANPVGTFTTTYTVTSGGCEDSTELTLIVVPDPVAGDDTELDLCQSEIEALFAEPDMDAALIALINNADTGGTFSPTLEEIAAQYAQDVENGNFPATYNLTYTVTNGQACVDSANVQIIVRQDADAGEPNSVSFCSNDLPATQTEAEIEQIYLGLLSEGVSTTGIFEPSIATITSDYNANPVGTFTTTYTVTNAQCEDSVELSFTVEEAVPADAGADTVITFCRVDGEQDLMNFLDESANPNGYFEEAEARAFNPSQAGTGTYTFTYTVDESSDCVTGSDSAIYTVEVTDTAAPTFTQGANVFCAYERPTIADLESGIQETGTVTWYTTATGTETVSSTEALQDGTTYYASITPASGCESFERTAVTVTLETCEAVIPEAFSPNGDRINDTFEITNLEQYPNYSIEIYNRYGKVVFKGNASSPNWDGVATEGSLGDKVLPVGVYFYILNYNDGQTPPTQGTVYLSR